MVGSVVYKLLIRHSRGGGEEMGEFVGYQCGCESRADRVTRRRLGSECETTHTLLLWDGGHGRRVLLLIVQIKDVDARVRFNPVTMRWITLGS